MMSQLPHSIALHNMTGYRDRISMHSSAHKCPENSQSRNVLKAKPLQWPIAEYKGAPGLLTPPLISESRRVLRKIIRPLGPLEGKSLSFDFPSVS